MLWQAPAGAPSAGDWDEVLEGFQGSCDVELVVATRNTVGKCATPSEARPLDCRSSFLVGLMTEEVLEISGASIRWSRIWRSQTHRQTPKAAERLASEKFRFK